MKILSKVILVLVGLLFIIPLGYAQQQQAVTASHVGSKVFLELNLSSLQTDLDSLFGQSAAGSSALQNLSWSDVLGNGTSPGMNVDFNGYSLLGSGQITTTGTLTGDSLVLNKDATITGRLEVSDVTSLSDSLLVSGVVEFGDSLRVVKAVSIGERLYVTGVTALGDSLNVVGNVGFEAMLEVAGAAAFGSTIDVLGVSTLRDTLHALAPALLGDSLNVAGNTHLQGDLQVDGAVNFNGTLGVTGATTLSDDLSVSGETTLSDTLHVNAPGLFSDSLYVAGGAAFGDDVTITGNSSVGGHSSVSGNSTVGGTLGVTGATTLSDDLSVSGETTLSDTLHVNAPGLFSDSLHVAGGADFDSHVNIDGNATVGGNSSVDGTMNVTGATTLSDNLTVNGETTMNDSLHVNAPALFGDSVHVAGNMGISGALEVTSLVINGVEIPAIDDTDALPEGSTNLYYTDARARAAMSGGTGVSFNSGVVAIGQDVATTSDVTFDQLNVDSIAATGALSLTGRATLSDSLIVNDGARFAATLFADSLVGEGLAITGGVQIQDGNQSAGRVLTSDASGNATWQDAVSPYTAGTGVDVTSNVISIGQDVSTSADVTFDDITADSLAISSVLTVGGSATFSDSLFASRAVVLSDSLIVDDGARFAATLFADSLVGEGLAITGGVQIQDGNQSAGRVLTSDASGNATWQDAVSPYTAGTGVDVTSNVISIGQDVSTSADVTFDEITADSLAMASALTVGGTATFSDSLFASKAVVLSDSLIVDDGARMTGTLLADSISTPGLAIGSAFKYMDGSQGANKILQSNAEGEATWVTLPATNPNNPSVAVIGVLSPTAPSMPSNTVGNWNTGSYIDLPPGDWSVQANAIVASDAVTGQTNAAIWVRTYFSSDPITLTPATTLTSGLIAGSQVSPASLGLATGAVVIRNATNSTQRYYWIAGNTAVTNSTNPAGTLFTFAGSGWGENSLIAFAVEDAGDGSEPAPSTITESGDIVISEPVTMRGINNPITKPTNMIVDEISLTDDGTGFCTVDMEYAFLNNAGAIGGVAETRIFALPAGYEFDLNFHSVSTAANMLEAANSWTYEGMRAMLPEGETGWVTNSAGSWGKVSVVPYSATEFRLGLTASSEPEWNYVGPSFAMIDPHALKVTFRFKSTKAEGGISRVNISGGTGVTVNTDNEISIGQDVATTSNVTFANVAASGLQVSDGNQAEGKVLVSDASGNASWQDHGNGAPKYAQFSGSAPQSFNPASPGGLVNFPVTDVNVGGFTLTNDNTITLPAGRVYQVELNIRWARIIDGGYCSFMIYNQDTGSPVSKVAQMDSKFDYVSSGYVSTFIDATGGAINLDVRYTSGGGITEISQHTGVAPSLTIKAVD